MNNIEMQDEEMVGRGTKDRFFLTAKIIKKKFNYRETQSRGKRWNETANSVVLVPEESDDATAFFKAWLPEKFSDDELAKLNGQKPYAEVVLEAGYPVSAYFRGALCNANHLYDRPHIFVMTKKAEERLLSHLGRFSLRSKTIKLTVLGEQEEEILYGDLKAETKSPYADLP